MSTPTTRFPLIDVHAHYVTDSGSGDEAQPIRQPTLQKSRARCVVDKMEMATT